MYTDWRWAELVLRGSHEQQSRQQGPPQFLGSPGGPNFRTETCSKYTLVALPPCEHWDRVWPFAFVFFLVSTLQAAHLRSGGRGFRPEAKHPTVHMAEGQKNSKTLNRI